ncbi:MAG: cysteine desulfurase [Lachnospiraceae bacterium]|nr:cysteine desulfurase [Lachnospiraceae bacterium]
MEYYLDNAATTRVFPEVAEHMKNIMLEDYGNPGSLHNIGFKAEKHLRSATEVFSRLLKCDKTEICFTSGGTESNNTAILGSVLSRRNRGNHLITTAVEHPAVANVMTFLEGEGFSVTRLKTDTAGRINLDELNEALTNETILVSIMHVNNEIGTIEPVEEAGRLIRKKVPECLFHVDDVQGFGKLPLLPGEACIDFLSVSAHKLHGPRGVGLLYVSKRAHPKPILHGGGQMGGLRSGTENVPGIAGFAEAAERVFAEREAQAERLRSLRIRLLEGLSDLEEVFVNGSSEPEDSAPGILSLSIKDIRAEVLLHALEEKGIFVSSGSACSSHHKGPSATLRAIGVPDWALESTIRISLASDTPAEAVSAVTEALHELIPLLRRYRRK